MRLKLLVLSSLVPSWAIVSASSCTREGDQLVRPVHSGGLADLKRPLPRVPVLDPSSEPDAWIPFTGNLGCRPAGQQPSWLTAKLPIPLDGCSFNYRLNAPHAVWNSLEAANPAGHVGAFGKGWNLEYEQSLEVTSDYAIVRAGDLTEGHFSLDERVEGGQTVRRWIPEPYYDFRLQEPAPGDDTWILVSTESLAQVYFQPVVPSSPYLHVVEVRDRHGLSTLYNRDSAGRLIEITNSVLASASDHPYWFRFTWAGDRISAIQNANDQSWTYTYAGGDLTQVTYPGGNIQEITYVPGTSLVSQITLPGLPTKPILYHFDPDGHFLGKSGLDGQPEYTTTFYDIAPDFYIMDLEGPHGNYWTMFFTAIPRGWYLMGAFVEGESQSYDRTEEGYLTLVYDDQGHRITYEPDDAPRPGTTTKIRHPGNEVDTGLYIEENTWGTYGRLVYRKSTPGGESTQAWAGLHDCGYTPPDWAFGQLCRTENGPDVVAVTYQTRDGGTANERRTGIVEHARHSLKGVMVIRDALGRIMEERHATGLRERYLRDERGFVVQVERQVVQSGPAPTNVGMKISFTYDKMGALTGDTTEPLYPVARRAPAAWKNQYERDASGALVNVRRHHNGVLLEQKQYQDPTASGIPQTETIDVMLPTGNLSARVEKQIDEYGRPVQTKSFVPDLVSGDATPYGTGHFLEGGTTTYQD